MAQEIIISGFGQGVMSMGQLLTYAGMLDGKNVSWLPSYGPEWWDRQLQCNFAGHDWLAHSHRSYCTYSHESAFLKIRTGSRSKRPAYSQ